jgi:hypothetical protein
VLGDGYRSGKSFHRAPLRSTHKMPSKHGRFSIGFGPPLGEAFGSGTSGAISAHCASVINSTFLAIEHLHSTASRTTIQASRKSREARIRQKPLHCKGYETGSRHHTVVGGRLACFPGDTSIA